MVDVLIAIDRNHAKAKSISEKDKVRLNGGKMPLTGTVLIIIDEDFPNEEISNIRFLHIKLSKGTHPLLIDAPTNLEITSGPGLSPRIPISQFKRLG